MVRGARITGKTLPYGRARLSLDVRVSRSRRFTYRSSTKSEGSGKFVFTVPYATEITGEEDVRAEGPYRIETGEGKAFSIRVPAAAVTEGREIEALP